MTITDSALFNKIANIDPNSNAKNTVSTPPKNMPILGSGTALNIYNIPDTITVEDVMFINEELNYLISKPNPGLEMEDYLNNPFKRKSSPLLIEDSIK